MCTELCLFSTFVSSKNSCTLLLSSHPSAKKHMHLLSGRARVCVCMSPQILGVKMYTISNKVTRLARLPQTLRLIRSIKSLSDEVEQAHHKNVLLAAYHVAKVGSNGGPGGRGRGGNLLAHSQGLFAPRTARFPTRIVYFMYWISGMA